VVVGVWHHPLYAQRTLRFWRQKKKQASIEKKNEKEEQEKLFEDEKKNAFSLSLHFLGERRSLLFFFFASFFLVFTPRVTKQRRMNFGGMPRGRKVRNT